MNDSEEYTQDDLLKGYHECKPLMKKHEPKVNDSDDYYNQKSESRSRILKPLTIFGAIIISIALWSWIFNCITKAL